MNKVSITISNVKLKGTLDFYVICKIHDDLIENNIDCQIQEIFKYISNIDSLGTIEGQITLISFLINSICRCSDFDEEDIADLFNKEPNETLEDIMISFQNRFEYINKLIKKCMPKGVESEFDDEDVYISKNDGWDFSHMEYLWYSVLKRSDDFYRATPKNFFDQMEQFNKAHSKSK